MDSNKATEREKTLRDRLGEKGVEPWDWPPPCTEKEPETQRPRSHRTLVADLEHLVLSSVVLSPPRALALVLLQQTNCQTPLGARTAGLPVPIFPVTSGDHLEVIHDLGRLG